MNSGKMQVIRNIGTVTVLFGMVMFFLTYGRTAEQAPRLLEVKGNEPQLEALEYLRDSGTSRGGNRGRQVTLESTGYTCGPESTGKHPSAPDYCQTASGYRLKPGDKVVAMGRKYPFGTTVIIPGYGLAVVRDRGGAVSDNHIDLYFDRDEDALKWGRRVVTVTVL
ncbi:MAG TPA: 3D domain-containing protein [Negativicutes bacterium]|nr:3D domain-containing protein [Negativicutes bacterium]